jgi:hypothetical protein
MAGFPQSSVFETQLLKLSFHSNDPLFITPFSKIEQKHF